MGRREGFHTEIREVFAKYGFVDVAYAGVDLMGADLYGFIVGERSRSVGDANRGRLQRMTGILETMKMDLNADLIRGGASDGEAEEVGS